MKKQSGFTLIELVIVIIILGILAVTAAPKFLNLQDDARTSTLKGVEGSLNSAGAMVYSKAVLKGKDKESTAYAGIHSVECFIIKDNALAARSGVFIVNVK